MSTPGPAARLYDVSYSRFSGAHEGRWRSVLALARSSTGRALGLRRSAGAKVWPFLLLLAAYLPAVIVVGIPLIVPASPPPLELLAYDELLGVGGVIIVAFVVTTLPSLLTRDRRDRVLTLYFSTALSRAEYLLGKLLAALALVLLVTLGPLLVLFVGSIVTADSPLERLRGLGGDLPAVLLAGLAVALYFSALGLAAGALTAKRVFAIGGLLGVLLVTPVLAGLGEELTGRRWTRVLDLATMPVRAAGHLLPDSTINDGGPSGAAIWTSYAVVVAGCLAVLALRYLRGGRS